MDDMETLRRAHGVELVREADDGSGVHRQPAGVYGFTYSPGLHDTPLFRKGGSRAFEVHKRPDGEVATIGYIAEAMAASTEIRLYPAPHGDATVLVAVPMSHVRSADQHTLREDGSLRIQLAAPLPAR